MTDCTGCTPVYRRRDPASNCGVSFAEANGRCEEDSHETVETVEAAANSGTGGALKRHWRLPKRGTCKLQSATTTRLSQSSKTNGKNDVQPSSTVVKGHQQVQLPHVLVRKESSFILRVFVDYQCWPVHELRRK